MRLASQAVPSPVSVSYQTLRRSYWKRDYKVGLGRLLLLCYGSSNKQILLYHCSILRSLEKACYINGFHRSNGAYYTTITPFAKEL